MTDQTPSPDTSSASIAAIVSDIEQDAPAPSGVDLPSITGDKPQDAQGSPANSSTSTELDSEGVQFDPSIHEPRKTQAGRWRRKRGRGAGGAGQGENSTGGHPSRLGSAPGQSTQLAPAGPDEFDAAAMQFTSMMAIGHMMLLGEQFGMKPEELQSVSSQMSMAFREAGSIPKMPWQASLALIWAGYVAPRFHHPETAKRVKSFAETIRGWWKKTFKTDRKPLPAASAETPAPSTPNVRTAPLPIGKPGNSVTPSEIDALSRHWA